MPGEMYWLVDATYREGIVKLTFILSPNQEVRVIEVPFTPYFYGLPKSAGETVTRQELLSGATIEVAKIPSDKQVKVERAWERDLDPTLSFVYDNRLRFGGPHQSTKEGFKPALEVSTNQRRAFKRRFGVIEQEDPLKYQFLLQLFEQVIQPVPTIPHQKLEIPSKFDEAKLFRGMMLARIGNMPLKHALTSRNVSEWIKSMLYTSYRQLGVLIPNPNDLLKGHKPHRVEGALTITPTPGAFFKMHVLDFESLYPSLIDHYNLSYETVDCEHPTCKETRVPETSHYVCTQRRGIYSALIGALKDLRIHWFKPQIRKPNLSEEERERAKIISNLLKFLLVSCGGVTIRIRGLACPPFAESMMAYGRWALRTSWAWAKEKGMRPVYGDTDSLFLDNPTPEQVKWLIAKANAELKLTLALDVVYTLCVLSGAKKAYFGILPDGTPDIKGLTIGKSSSPPLFRDIFADTVAPLASVDNLEKLAQAQPKVTEVLRRRIAQIRRGRFTVPDMEQRIRIWKDPSQREPDSVLTQPYQAWQQLADAGITIKRREEVAFVKVKPFRYGKRTFSVKPTQMASKREIDIPDYIRRLELAFQQVLEPLGIPFPREPSTGLDEFLSSDPQSEERAEADTIEEKRREKRSDPQKRLVDYS
jgi:DNA polymerase elongation subunit (family B)